MSAQPTVVHAVPGRLRVHLSGWEGHGARRLSDALATLEGVVGATARPETGNVVVRYDPAATDADALVAAIGRLDVPPRAVLEAEGEDGDDDARDPRLGQLLRAAAGSRRARIAVRGLDRDPLLARRVVERLQARPDVRRVQVSPTTGRALIEFSGRVLDAEDLLADLTDLELPDEPGQDLPEHPLDPVPLVQAASRTIGAGVGLVVVGIRTAGGHREPISGAAVGAAAALGVVRSLPRVRAAVHALFGREKAEVVLGVAEAVALTASAAPLGLAMTAVAGLQLVTEIVARRRAWRAYEERLGEDDAPMPGESVRLVPGERVPLRSRVVEGHGTVAAADGMPRPCGPGDIVGAGSRVVSGSLAADVVGHAAFAPPVRPVPAPLPPVRRYAELLGVASLGYAGASLLVTRSPMRALIAVLLVNPRPALIGADVADAGASARVLRSGSTIVGTRPDRVVHRPDVLVLERPRVATDGFEVARVVALSEDVPADLPILVDAALRVSGGRSGEVVVHGGRYVLDNPASVRDHPAHADLRERGEHGMVIRREDGSPLALVALRPRPALGLDALAAACGRRGTRLVMVEHGDRFAARSVARRAGAELILEADVPEVIADLQAGGASVAVVVDGADAAEALAASDLGIGLTSGLRAHFPARADVLAPDLSAVAAIVETGARRDRAGLASVAASLAANVVGVLDGLRGEAGIVRASRATYLAALAAMAAGWLLLRGGAPRAPSPSG